jgi:hypothetical protein
MGHLIARLDHGDLACQKSARAAARHPGAPWYVHLQAAAAEIADNDLGAAQRHVMTALAQRPDMTFAKYRTSFRFPTVDQVFEIGDRNGANERMIETGLPRD